MSATGNSPRPANERGFTSSWRSAEHGFTLVELMVVLVIVGFACAVVLFAMPDPRGDVREAGERLAARVRVAQDLAIVGGRPLALTVDAHGYRFERRVAGRWTAPGEPALAPQAWAGGIAARIAGEGRVLFDPTGGADPLAVTLERDGARATVRVGADGGVHVG